MMIPEFIAATFALLVLIKSYDEFRRGREPLPVFLFWLITWGAVLVVAFFPSVTDWMQARLLGPRAGLGTILGIAIVFLLFLAYRLYLKADRVERDLNRLISELALRDFDQDRLNNRLITK
jgi:hypothetical protein